MAIRCQNKFTATKPTLSVLATYVTLVHAYRSRPDHTSWLNQGITAAHTDYNSSCNVCEQPILLGHRIVVQHDEGIYCKHLECASEAGLLRFDKPHRNPPPFTARHDGTCACCTAPIEAGRDRIKASWMGWIHQSCEAGSFDSFLSIMRRLQAHYFGMTMPAASHSWNSIGEFRNYVSQLEEASDSDSEVAEDFLLDMGRLQVAA